VKRSSNFVNEIPFQIREFIDFYTSHFHPGVPSRYSCLSEVDPEVVLILNNPLKLVPEAY